MNHRTEQTAPTESSPARKAIVASSKGFTIVELMVVVTIIAALIALLLPSLSSIKERQRTLGCLINERSIGQAVMLYMGDHGNTFPATTTTGAGSATYPWYSIVYDTGAMGTNGAYSKAADILHCPDDTATPASPTHIAQSVSYGYNWMGLAGLDPLAWNSIPFNPASTNNGYISTIGGVGSAHPNLKNPARMDNIASPGATLFFVETATGPSRVDQPTPRLRNINASPRAASAGSTTGGVAFGWHGNPISAYESNLCNVVWVDGHATSVDSNGSYANYYLVSIFGDGETGNSNFWDRE